MICYLTRWEIRADTESQSKGCPDHWGRLANRRGREKAFCQPSRQNENPGKIWPHVQMLLSTFIMTRGKEKRKNWQWALLLQSNLFLSSFNNYSRWISQPENCTCCRKLYCIYYHKDNISVVRIIKGYLGAGHRYYGILNGWLFHINYTMFLFLAWHKQTVF